MFKKFPFKNNSFDTTFCFQAMYHGRLEQIMYCLSEIKRVTKDNGYFFGTFMSHEENIKYDKKEKSFFFYVQPTEKKRFKAWIKQDEAEPHLFYFLSKDWEYMVPHYYFTKDELKVILNQFFKEVNIKLVKNKIKGRAGFWFVACKGMKNEI